MRTLPLSIASLLGAASLAHADPANNYLETGLGLSADRAVQITGTLEAGRRVTPELWVHGLFESGSSDPRLVGTYEAGRLGAESRSCELGGAICAVGGLDVGVRQVEYDHTNETGAVLVPRLGLDIGNRVFRVRPGIEKNALTTVVFDGIALTGAIALQW